MDLLPTVAVPAAAVTVLRAAWVYLRNLRQSSKPDVDKLRKRATSWIARAIAHFAGQRATRTWLLHYALDRYVLSLETRHEKLSIPGRLDLPIDRCYIPLELRAGQMTDAVQIPYRSGAVLILGDPGTGKSAMLSQIIRSLCHECMENREAARLPVYIPLRQIVSYLPTGINRDLRPDEAMAVLESWFKDYQVAPLNLYESAAMLSTLAQATQHGVVLLFDGLDEIGTNEFAEVESFLLAIMNFMATAPANNLIIITSRRQALDFTPRLLNEAVPNLVPVELSPFSPAAIYAFLLRWPYYRSPQHPAREASRIFSQLRLNPTLLDTCSNPLALALYVDHDYRIRQLGYEEGVLQPDTRAAFFNDIVDYLMIRRRYQQSQRALPTRPFRQARIDFFVAVVDEHIRSQDQFGVISDETALKFAAGLARQGQTAEEALAELARDTGIISRDHDGSWRFIHESFLNYFLACSIASVSRNRDLAQLLRRLQTAPLRYLEGFYLACGLMASRSSPYLATVLHDLGYNAFVGRYYPRAVLEAQAYFGPGFVDRIRFFCSFWKRNTHDLVLFRDLVAVLADYERSCDALGRPPEVTARVELGQQLGQIPVLHLPLLDIDLSLRRQDETMGSFLSRSATEDAIVTLYDPSVAEKLDDAEIESDPRLAAIVAEAALRSSLFLASLAPPPKKARRERAPIIYPDEPWADSWPIRGSRFARILSIALPYLRGLDVSSRSNFPHLHLLAFARPIRRLRNELFFGDWRMSILLLSLLVVAVGPFWLVGFDFELIGVGAVAVLVALTMLFRQAMLRGIISANSLRILNMQPLDTGQVTYSGRSVRIVSGDQKSLKRWRFRTPHRSEGAITAAYIHDLPLAWRRFCPALGDENLSRIGCASLQQFWTEDVRRIVGR